MSKPPDDKFSNMISLLFELVQEIEKEDLINNNLTQRQKININKIIIYFIIMDNYYYKILKYYSKIVLIGINYILCNVFLRI